MALPAEKPYLSYADYLALEADTGVRHEYLDGEAWAMAGGTLRHSAIKTNLTIAVGLALRGRPCRAYDSDAKMLVTDTGLATYPDLAIVCGPVAQAAQDRHAAVNPTVLFEVLSPSTEAWDRGEKFRHYRHLGSLQQYVLISADTARVEVFTRGLEGTWVMREAGPGGQIALDSVQISIEVDELYADLPDDAATAPEGATA